MNAARRWCAAGWVLLSSALFAETVAPIHLGMDSRMVHQWQGLLRMYGVNLTGDAVVGQAMSFENHAYFELDPSVFSTWGRGDFTISFWLKPDERVKAVPDFLMGETTQSCSVFEKTEAGIGGFNLSFFEGVPGFLPSIVLNSIDDYVMDSLVELRGDDRVMEVLWDGAWHHYGIVRAGVEFRTYLDGQLLATWNDTRVRDLSNAAPLRVGVAHLNNRSWYVGLLDEMIFDFRAWSADELHAHWEEFCPRASSNR